MRQLQCDFKRLDDLIESLEAIFPGVRRVLLDRIRNLRRDIAEELERSHLYTGNSATVINSFPQSRSQARRGEVNGNRKWLGLDSECR